MKVSSNRKGWAVRIPALVASLAVPALAAVIFGATLITGAQAQETEGAMSVPTLTSDTHGTVAVTWEVPSLTPSDYRIDWAKSGEGYKSWKVDEGHIYPEGSETTATIEGLDPGVEYKVRMRARYHKGDHERNPWSGPWTGDATITVSANADEEQTPTPTPTPTREPDPVPSGTIIGLTASNPQPGSLLITWDLPDLEPTDYRVVWHKVGERVPSWRDASGNAYTSFETYLLTGLQEDADYRVLVRARYYGSAHNPPWSGPFSNTTARVSYGLPADPTNLTFSGVTHQQATLRWQAPRNSKVTGYRITRAKGDETAETLVADTGDTRTYYADPALDPATTYTYRVSALNDLGAGPESASADVTTHPMPLPRPTGLAASYNDQTHVVLTWDRAQGEIADHITGYRIRRGANAESLTTLVDDTLSPANSWTDVSVSAGATYVYAVQARSAHTSSPESEPLTVPVLAPPGGLTGRATVAGVILNWDAPSDQEIIAYQVLRGDSADLLDVLVDDTGSAATVYVDATTAPGSTYYYAVRARNALGLSPVSNTFAATTAPAAPIGLTAVSTHDRVLLSWDAPPATDAVTGYQVLRGPDPASLVTLVETTGSVDPWYVDATASEETAYAYAVKAIGEGGTGEPSNVLEVTTLAQRDLVVVASDQAEEPLVAAQQQEGEATPPPAPRLLQLFASHDGVTLQWRCSCGRQATGFRIMRGPTPGALETLVADTGNITPWFRDTDVDPAETYTYAVASLNGSAESAGITIRSVTTPMAPAYNVMISNLVTRTRTSATSTAYVGNLRTAQAFRTGSNPQGYAFDGVWVNIYRDGSIPIDPKVSIYEYEMLDLETVVFELTPPERDVTAPAIADLPQRRMVSSYTFGKGPEFFAAPAGAWLGPNRYYQVVFEQGTATDQAYAPYFYTHTNPLRDFQTVAAEGWRIYIAMSERLDTLIFSEPKILFNIHSNRRQIAVMGIPAQ